MRSKIDFYKLFFEQLSRQGFEVKRSDSSDYLADIHYKGQLIAFYTKADTIEKNPFVTVKDKVLNLINDTAKAQRSEPVFALSALIPKPMRSCPTVPTSWQSITA